MAAENVAINEIWKVTVQGTADSLYVVDLTTTLTTPLEGGSRWKHTATEVDWDSGPPKNGEPTTAPY